MGKRVPLWTPHEEYLSLGEIKSIRTNQYRSLVCQALSAEVVQTILQCVNPGLILGTESIREQVKALEASES